jgi:hypothetical protein
MTDRVNHIVQHHIGGMRVHYRSKLRRATRVAVVPYTSMTSSLIQLEDDSGGHPKVSCSFVCDNKYSVAC